MGLTSFETPFGFVTEIEYTVPLNVLLALKFFQFLGIQGSIFSAPETQFYKLLNKIPGWPSKNSGLSEQHMNLCQRMTMSR